MTELSKGMIPPGRNVVRRFDVNRANQPEGVYQPLYDYQTYPAIGATQMTFFAVPLGQGVVPKTYADTNMESAGLLPAPKEMLVDSIQVAFFPGIQPGRTVAAGGAVDLFLNDVWTIGTSGWLEFFIGSKTYLYDAPIGKFTNDFRMSGFAALGDLAASPAQTLSAYSAWVGKSYKITPVRLISNQNFRVTINWPALVPTPSTVAGRIGVILNGFLYRLSQ